jgi:hypothetical protein
LEIEMARAATTRSQTQLRTTIPRLCAVMWDRHYDRDRRRHVAELRQRERGCPVAEDFIDAMVRQLEEIRALPEPSRDA